MIKLIADSTCDLSLDILTQYNIDIVPLTIDIDGNIYKDRTELEPEVFYSMLKDLTSFPTTGAPSPSEYVDVMKQAVADGHEAILCICMSSGTSASYQSAELAKGYFFEEYPDSDIKVHVVDSKSMSHGSGWLLIKSAMMREQGASFEELVTFNEEYKTKVKHFLSVDDLNHLIRSGRISNASAMLGKFLMLKPIMTMKDGKGAVVAKARGRKKVIRHYVQEFIERHNPDLTDFIIIGYTDDQIVATDLKSALINETDFTGEVHLMQMGVAVGTHVGLGAISMFFMEK
ncbi:DegV family protein [Jeotgalibacillus sp. R-1-5s-1]|uniref:DegV family protein n=1 Tax=Jeotgalibacillus sp. R-1-5s-1 TaxID=2555897 RepID=UPI00106CB36E|nr:DegV family protein [Jeotgalibacillus sp. R-1-5s-1]TFE00181.1 DegV family protein [Jeotgalibacillus sp. R-1-5s-1]